MSRGVIDRAMERLADIVGCYGRAYNMNANMNLTSSSQKVNFTNFTGAGCSLSSGGIKVSKSGVYEISAEIYTANNFTQYDIVHAQIFRNSTSNQLAHSQLQIDRSNGMSWTTFVVGKVVVSLSANDVIYLYAYNQGGSRGAIATSANATTSLTLNRIA